MHTLFSRNSLLIAAASVLAIAPAAPPSRACSVCGCSLSSDWASQGYSMSPGIQADVDYQYYDQDDLRTGTGHADRPALPVPDARELQRDTLTRAATLGLDYVVAPAWAVALDAPFYDRFHSTIAPGDTALSESRASGPGDVRLTARYQAFSPTHSLGLQWGLKLPTGRFDQDFATGPQAGNPLDRGLQLGTGTTDLIAGASFFARPVPVLGYFAQATVQQAIEARDGFVPSATLNVNTGLRYLNPSPVTPLLQLNARWDGREHGVNADSANSGDAACFASPGVTVQLGLNRSLFAFLQVPVYQRVNGLQLEPRWLVSLGFRWSR